MLFRERRAATPTLHGFRHLLILDPDPLLRGSRDPRSRLAGAAGGIRNLSPTAITI
jgi:hypothetical protein